MAPCSIIYCLRDWFRTIETNKNETAKKRRQASFSYCGWVWICFRQLGGKWVHSLPCLLPTHCCHPQHQGQSRAATEISLPHFPDEGHLHAWPGTLSILRADLHIQLNPEKACAATIRSIHVILFPLDTTFFITLTEVTAVSIKSGVNCGLKLIWEGGKKGKF